MQWQKRLLLISRLNQVNILIFCQDNLFRDNSQLEVSALHRSQCLLDQGVINLGFVAQLIDKTMHYHPLTFTLYFYLNLSLFFFFFATPWKKHRPYPGPISKCNLEPRLALFLLLFMQISKNLVRQTGYQTQR